MLGSGDMEMNLREIPKSYKSCLLVKVKIPLISLTKFRFPKDVLEILCSNGAGTVNRLRRYGLNALLLLLKIE